MDKPTEQKCVLLCARCAEDVGITLSELENAIMLPKPLTDAEAFEVIKEVMGRTFFGEMFRQHELDIARAIERKHGIK